MLRATMKMSGVGPLTSQPWELGARRPEPCHRAFQ